jgi:hypothetical protein
MIMQLSDREIQNSLDFLKTGLGMSNMEPPARNREHDHWTTDLLSRIDVIPDIRQDEVEMLREKIENACYDINPDDVAKKMIGRVFSDKLH